MTAVSFRPNMNLSPPSSTEVKNEWIYTSFPLYVFIVWTGTTLRFTSHKPMWSVRSKTSYDNVYTVCHVPVVLTLNLHLRGVYCLHFKFHVKRWFVKTNMTLKFNFFFMNVDVTLECGNLFRSSVAKSFGPLGWQIFPIISHFKTQ